MKWFLILCLMVVNIGTSQPDNTPTELRLLTHNLHSEEVILDPMVAILDAADADIVALQEVSQAAFDRVEAAFANRYPYRIAGLADGRWSWMALFSRYEIMAQTVWPMDEIRLIRVVLNVNGTPITVFNVHPVNPGTIDYDTSLRSKQIAFLLEQANNETNPVILMGDFNTEEWSDDYAAITENFTDAFRALHPDRLGATYPDYSLPQARVNARLPRWSPPLLRIDYVFHTAEFESVEAQVWPESSGSDHRPMWAVVRYG